ncbi:MAG: hypothetical protein HZC47_10970 [Methanobacterium sp.]|uniref:hypothetical protein n=1 Tax=Methanobacterium sp. TaxID=2164 RepID=UPI003D658319|nr:hypothetical protein [Methanobacterium sp.]
MSENKFERTELFYLLMNSWIYSIEKTREELLGNNIAYTKRIGWNATEFILKHLKKMCEIDFDGENKLDTLESIVKCLEDMDFIKKGDITVQKDKNTFSIAITGCGANACKELVNNNIMPQVCLRSIILATMLENATGVDYAYTLKADPPSQPKGVCTTYLENP